MSEKLGPLSRSWITKDEGSDMSVYLTMRGRVTVQEFLEYMASHHPHVDAMQAELNFATAHWTDRPTDEELASRKEWRARQAERHERWEREIYTKPRAKFEGGEV